MSTLAWQPEFALQQPRMDRTHVEPARQYRLASGAAALHEAAPPRRFADWLLALCADLETKASAMSRASAAAGANAAANLPSGRT